MDRYDPDLLSDAHLRSEIPVFDHRVLVGHPVDDDSGIIGQSAQPLDAADAALSLLHGEMRFTPSVSSLTCSHLWQTCLITHA